MRGTVLHGSNGDQDAFNKGLGNSMRARGSSTRGAAGPAAASSSPAAPAAASSTQIAAAEPAAAKKTSPEKMRDVLYS